LLSYGTKGGIHYGDVMEMEPGERNWYVERLARQFEDETKEHEKAMRATRKPSRVAKPPRRRRKY